MPHTPNSFLAYRVWAAPNIQTLCVHKGEACRHENDVDLPFRIVCSAYYFASDIGKTEEKNKAYINHLYALGCCL